MAIDYALEPAKWGTSSVAGTPGGTVSWNYSGSFSSAYQSEITAAFGRWSQVANISFVHVTDGGSANITFHRASIDGPGATLGTTSYSYSSGLMQHADVTFDTGEMWSSSANGLVSGGAFYFEAVALHEIGHALGLGHYDATTAVMNAYIAINLRDLTASDIHGIQALYGAAPSLVSASSQGGTHTVTRLDTENQYAWSSLMTTFNESSQRTSILYTYDNGTQRKYQYDVDSQKAWSTVVSYFDASRHRTQVLYNYDDGSKAKYIYDVSDQHSWSSIVSYFDADGHRARVVYNNDDGSHTLYQFNSDQGLASKHTYDSHWVLIG